MPASGSTYPDVVGWGGRRNLLYPGGKDPSSDGLQTATAAPEDPSARTAAVLAMMPYWTPINICVAGTNGLHTFAESIVPREVDEEDDAYKRRIFHSTLPPYLQRLASQAAGTILRRGIHLEGGDQEWFEEWSKDVTGDGTPLNEFCRKTLVDALLFGHSSILVDFTDDNSVTTLAEERQRDSKPYLVSVPCQEIRGWRTENNRATAALEMVRYSERVSIPDGEFGEEVCEQIRVLRPGSYQVYRYSSELPDKEKGNGETMSGWYLQSGGTTTLDEIPLATVYSNRIATLTSKPPMVEVAELNISYAQRFTDYFHSIHVGAQPILVLKGFDAESSDNKLGLSVNTAVLLPPDGDAMYVEPTSDVYDAQLRCLQALEAQICSLGVSILAQTNITNASAEAKRIDRIDSDSIMAIVSEDMARTIEDVMRMVGKYAGREAPKVTIQQDFTNRLLDGNQITALLQLQMQNQISQETLLTILSEGELLPPHVDIGDEVARTRDQVDEQFDLQLEQAEAMQSVEISANEGGVTSGKAANGSQIGSQTLETPMRSGKHAA